jgi:hypothetical protein
MVFLSGMAILDGRKTRMTQDGAVVATNGGLDRKTREKIFIRTHT